MLGILSHIEKLPNNGFAVITFAGVWVIYFAILALLGLSPAQGSLVVAVSYQVMFVALAILPLIVLPDGKRSAGIASAQKSSNLIIYAGLVISLFGICCLLGDKLAAGVDYTKDLCSARYQMNDLAQGRTGVRSIFSLLGNLFSTTFFVSIIAVINGNVSRKKFYFVFIAAFILLLLVTFITSSRTGILLFGAFTVAAAAIRLGNGHPIPRLKWADTIGAAIIAGTACLYVVAVFDCRATDSNLNATQYEKSYVEFLGAKDDLGGDSGSHIIPARIRGLVGVTALYFVHSAYTFAGILGTEERPGHATFVYARELLNKVALLPKDSGEDWEFAGKFPSFPGGFYYDFGAFGLSLSAILLGLLAWVGGRILSMFPGNAAFTGILAAIYVTMLMSPILFAGEVLAFPFICFSIVVVPFLAYIINAMLALLNLRKGVEGEPESDFKTAAAE